MRSTLNLLLAALAALAALAVLTTPAFAQSIEITPEDSSTHCGDVTVGADHAVSGGCMVHVTSGGNTQTFLHTGITEVMTSDCTSQFTTQIGEDGAGYAAMNDASIGTNPASGCLLTACDEAGGGGETVHPELEWPISGIFEYGAAREAVLMTVCVRPYTTAEGASNAFCTIAADITNTPSTHQQEVTAVQEPCFENPAQEISAHWLTEANLSGSEVEIEAQHVHFP